MIWIKGGSFQMGSNRWEEEKPIHKVKINSFYIGEYEVMQKQYREIMGKNPSEFSGDNNPVEQVSWYDAVEFCNKLSELVGLTKCYSKSGKIITCNFKANGYRLPTEAEWEYAAHGGALSNGYKYSGSDDMDEVARCNNSETTHVGTKKPNELGIYDMSGNVKEWCWDKYDKNYCSSSSFENPRGGSGYSRILRGGGWLNIGDEFYSTTSRENQSPNDICYYVGFRIALTP